MTTTSRIKYRTVGSLHGPPTIAVSLDGKHVGDYNDSHMIPRWRYEFDEAEDDHAEARKHAEMDRADRDDYDDHPYSMPVVNSGGYTMTEEEAEADAREDDDDAN